MYDRRTRVMFLALFTVCFLGAFIVTTSAASESGAKFVQKATIGNQFEISSSRLALQNSQDDNVKGFAQQMIDDHTKAGDDLKSAISSSNTNLAQPSPSLDSKHQKMLDKLNKLQGPAFDKKYVADQVGAHDEAVKLFKDYAANGDNKDLKYFAAQTLPTLQEHQSRIDQMKGNY